MSYILLMFILPAYSQVISTGSSQSGIFSDLDNKIQSQRQAIDNLNIGIKELQSGRPTITGLPNFFGGMRIGQGANISTFSSNGILSMNGLITGSVLFAIAGGTISQNNPFLFWDNTNVRLGINTTSPQNALSVNGAASFGLAPSVSTFTSAGNLVIAANGNITVPTGALIISANGLTNPSFKLFNSGDVSVNTTVDSGNFRVRTSANENFFIQTGDNVGGDGAGGINIRANNDAAAVDVPFTIAGSSVAFIANGAQAMVIGFNQAVGIGTRQPAKTLDISGTLGISSTTYIGGVYVSSNSIGTQANSTCSAGFYVVNCGCSVANKLTACCESNGNGCITSGGLASGCQATDGTAGGNSTTAIAHCARLY